MKCLFPEAIGPAFRPVRTSGLPVSQSADYRESLSNRANRLASPNEKSGGGMAAPPGLVPANYYIGEIRN